MSRTRVLPPLLPAAVALLYGGFLIRYGIGYAGIDFVDLPTFHSAARAAFGEGVSPYTAAFLDRAGAEAGRHIFPYLYPPPSLLFFYPLSLLSYRAAAILLLTVNHLCLAALGWLLLRVILPPLPGRFAPLAVAYALLYHPLVVTLGTGQVNLPVLLLLCATWALLRRGSRAPLVALPLAASILLKVYPVIFLPWLLLRRRTRAAGWTLGYCALGLALAAAVLPPETWADWAREVAPTAGYGDTPFRLFSPAAPFNQSLNAFAARLFLPNEFSEALLPSPAAARLVAWLLAGAVAAATFAALLRSGRHRAAIAPAEPAARLMDVEASLVLATMTLVAPISWEHHLVFVLPAVLVVLREASEPPVRPLPAVALVGAAALLAWRIPVWSKLFSEGVLTLAISIKTYAVVVVWAYLAGRVWRAGRSAS